MKTKPYNTSEAETRFDGKLTDIEVKYKLWFNENNISIDDIIIKGFLKTNSFSNTHELKGMRCFNFQFRNNIRMPEGLEDKIYKAYTDSIKESVFI